MRFITYWLGSCLILLFVGCKEVVTDSSASEKDLNILVQQQCGRCHAVPDPSDLDRITWQNHVLPRMGYFMGRYDAAHPRASLIESDVPEIEQQGIFPEKATIDEADWNRITDYYLANAPQRLQSDTLQFSGQQQTFQPHFPSLFLSPPGSLLTRFSPSGGYFIADVHKEQLLFSDGQHQLRAGFPATGGIVDIQTEPDRLVLTSIGSFSPTDRADGSILTLDLTHSSSTPESLISGLQRPVQCLSTDMNGDGRLDLVIPEFGKWTGGLSWWEQLEDGSYEEHSLRAVSGALRVAIDDLNGDQLPDIIALFGQGNEGFWAYYNQGNGQFKEQLLFRLPPSYGSSFFTLTDWDQDGLADILYTNGDNADYTPIIKPYHGIHLYTQQSAGIFEETWFLALPGAYQARMADFNLDGYQDIVAISFFPDFQRQPEQSIVLFQGEANAKFSPKHFSQAKAGRWITMDVADNDRDGDYDLLIGSMAFEVVPPVGLLEQWINNGLGWVYFENLTKK